ncbi:tail fiber assembly protein [Morganella morganii]|uniref:tail fiber assembly protein n=1 Tax=Morganella morganii TaxID=582 RepID=UPI0025B54DD9|nr:tail fiber assembly protein [Morganella morganii]MDN3816940.1 tail fiber assembly protein [Morganella morganii]
MKYYKDKNDVVYALNPDEDPVMWLDMKVTEISEDEADILRQPKLTQAQRIEMAEEQKQYLISEVHTETQMLQTKLALGRIKDDEKTLLNAWLDYLDELEAVDVSTAPDIIWPVKPEV